MLVGALCLPPIPHRRYWRGEMLNMLRGGQDVSHEAGRSMAASLMAGKR